MRRFLRISLLVLPVLAVAVSCKADRVEEPRPAPEATAMPPEIQPTAREAQNLPPATPLRPGMLLQFDFNNGNPWREADSDPASNFKVEDVGTIDTYQGKPGGALRLTCDFSNSPGKGRATLESGRFPISNTEPNLAKLTLSFDLWVSEVRRVRVHVVSFDTADRPTGARFATLLPPVEGAFYRFSVDLDKTKPVTGNFDPLAPKLALIFELNDEDGPGSPAKQTLRVDNVSLTAPAFYVNPQGNDTADGRTEQTAFATIAKAVDAAGAGDVICLIDGIYRSSDVEEIVKITKSGSPAGWIVLRANPGHKPELAVSGWNAIRVNGSASYWEFRDLTVRGNAPKLKLADALADGLITTRDDKKYGGNPIYNSNGISIQNNDVTSTERPHHIRIRNNRVLDCPGGGISAINCDYVTIEGNFSSDNCHFMRYAGSGISVFRSWDFDGFKGHKMFVLGNVTCRNQCLVPWTQIGKISDGNGIIIDDNICHQAAASKVPYEGRTLVQNNVSYGNGGSGIHAYASRFVDIVNNTAYHNVQSPELKWSQIFAGGRCEDVRIFNNVFHAQQGKPLDLSTPKSSKDIVYAHNLIFGDGDNDVKSSGGLGVDDASTQGRNEGNLRANPKFVRASLGPDADFHLAPDSPGIDAGSMQHPGTPRNDIEGRPRPQGLNPDMGAYELAPKP